MLERLDRPKKPEETISRSGLRELLIPEARLTEYDIRVIQACDMFFPQDDVVFLSPEELEEIAQKIRGYLFSVSDDIEPSTPKRLGVDIVRYKPVNTSTRYTQEWKIYKRSSGGKISYLLQTG
ncbi:MAG: hypothetical protein A2233_00880 [Candidatus Kerfeldbacteria bacterium RIFOXYA2_FULL_38_24]|uniref:Uncharacterized protein n=1 Tax=Candidatus Kerfeldbacteria bacterium RIFOXYB2_FULL_38_14 TaxID=1798547 RepID=A0A1G2BFV2_9BACT|nr:MAG: hypothetical protein A2233_00880 [Candidatus Kerfeldbacteria bacterium RIFOXYA2_FULL_38_24]OGY88108.1 MAG: hypothetical protein A2319_01610 [Candidatus Kerfeldbacteria bacterium RIFOXYB2_FULL_38_14]OGY88737.1 MAG: hypothetical protein A2458_03120 [Candidatus Kerfeldbacteria bacterium RIFOXYC2_FULL_38_9]